MMMKKLDLVTELSDEESSQIFGFQEEPEGSESQDVQGAEPVISTYDADNEI